MPKGVTLETPPCPDRVADDLGSAFVMGLAGGSVFHSIKGAWNAPRGDRWNGARYAVKLRAPAVGSGFAVWGGLFSTFDCILIGVRRREDILNPILSGAATGGLLAARAGAKQIARQALFGGVILAVIEGVMYGVQKLMPATPPEAPAMVLEAPRGMDRIDDRSAAGMVLNLPGVVGMSGTDYNQRAAATAAPIVAEGTGAEAVEAASARRALYAEDRIAQTAAQMRVRSSSQQHRHIDLDPEIIERRRHARSITVNPMFDVHTRQDD